MGKFKSCQKKIAKTAISILISVRIPIIFIVKAVLLIFSKKDLALLSVLDFAE